MIIIMDTLCCSVEGQSFFAGDLVLVQDVGEKRKARKKQWFFGKLVRKMKTPDEKVLSTCQTKVQNF